MRPDNDKRVYLMEGETNTVYLKNCITDPDIQVGEHTYYNDFVNDPRDFEKNNVLYHFPQFYHDSIIIGKYCSIACGASFICPSACHKYQAMSTYPFGIVNDHWDMPAEMTESGNIVNLRRGTVVGNDVWLGYQSIIMPGVHIGDGACVGTRSIVTKDVEPYTIVAGAPARPVRKRFDDKTIERLLALKWWDLPDNIVRMYLPRMLSEKDLNPVIDEMEIAKATWEVMKRLQAIK